MQYMITYKLPALAVKRSSKLYTNVQELNERSLARSYLLLSEKMVSVSVSYRGARAG